MAVVMNGLRRLHKSMVALGMDRYRFDYEYGQAQFDVIFLADERPHILLLGLRGGSMAFEFKVSESYAVQDTTMAGDEYKALVKLLGLRYDPENRFRPSHFLEWVDRAAPVHAQADNRPKASDVFRFRRDVEEERKIYFRGWQHYRKGERGPTGKNLAKTRKLLGHRYYVTCRDRKISSCWTDVPRDECILVDP